MTEFEHIALWEGATQDNNRNLEPGWTQLCMIKMKAWVEQKQIAEYDTVAEQMRRILLFGFD